MMLTQYVKAGHSYRRQRPKAHIIKSWQRMRGLEVRNAKSASKDVFGGYRPFNLCPRGGLAYVRSYVYWVISSAHCDEGMVSLQISVLVCNAKGWWCVLFGWI